jgi:charged multivesicular body protein 4
VAKCVAEYSIKMSFFGKMFGKKEEKAPSTGEAIQKLKETEDMLIKKQEYLEAKIDQEVVIAKKNASKNKRGKRRGCH